MFFASQSPLSFIAHLLIGGVFVFAGLRNVANRGSLTGILAGRGVAFPGLMLAAGIVLQITAGALLIAGLWTDAAALGLLAFLAAATLIFHNFWDHQGPDRISRINGLASNVALAGAFLLILAQGQ
ncbi:MAG: DoxX family protein [Mesorhizobium sp.]|nr:DoxX family protein [Mesorhizobium sp.]